MVVKSLINKTRYKFNVSIAEIDYCDYHQSIAIGFACVSGEMRHAESMVRNILRFIEDNTEAVVDDVCIEFL